MKKMKSCFKGLVASAAVLGIVFASASSALADAPRFNFVQGDYSLIRGANKTNGETSAWKNPVVGDPGDEFVAIVYVHNGIVGTTATNTKVKVNIPSVTTNNSALITASISADNAATVTSTIVNGAVVGANGLTVNLSEDAALQYIPGSVRWLPNFTDTHQVQEPLLYGQSGDEIVNGAGLNIGNVNGCFEFIHYVTFRFKAVAAIPSFALQKYVRDVTSNETTFVKENTAYAGDTLEYKVTFGNTGAVLTNGVIVSDTLPANTTYVAGSTVVSINEGAFTALPDGITQDGVTVNLKPADNGVIKFKVKLANGLAAQKLTNTAYLSYNKQTLSDIAKTNVAVHGTPGQPGTPTLPQTGAGTTTISALIALFASLAFAYRKKLAALKVLVR